MPIVRERIARQGGKTACFAEIEVEVTLADHPGAMLVEFGAEAETTEGDWYLPAVHVGVQLALSLAPQRQQVRVVIRRLITTTTDSTEIIVLRTAARAVLRALGADPELAGPMSLEERTVTFPFG